MDGDSSQPSPASSRRGRRDTAFCLTTSQPSTNSARKHCLRQARQNTRIRGTLKTADLECGDFQGDTRGLINSQNVPDMLFLLTACEIQFWP